MRNRKIWLFAAFVAALLVIYFFTPAREYLSKEGFDKLKDWILATGPLAPVLFILIYMAATIFCLPGSLLTLAAGAIFGTGLGTLYVVIASNLGANGAFLISRYLGQEIASRLLRGKMAKIELGMEKSGFNLIFGLRLLPVVPFSAFNYAAGITPVKWKDYCLGSFLGMLPGTFVYVSLGGAASRISFSDPQFLKDPQVWGPFALVIALAIFLKLLKKKKPLKNPTPNQEVSYGSSRRKV